MRRTQKQETPPLEVDKDAANTHMDMSTGEVYGLSSPKHECWGTLLHVHARSTERVAKRVEAESGIPLDWYDVLLALEKAPEGRLRMGELVEHVTLSRSGLTRLVDRIEAAGLVERRLCRQDRRAFEAVLTSKGQQAREKSWPILARVIAQEFGNRYSDEEAVQLSTLLKRQL
jgi:DNA-binding MarR family transcriptional regulator